MRDTIDMAREAGMRDCTCSGSMGCLKAFEALVRADERNRTWTQEHWTEYERSIAAQEREACAKTRAGKPRELKPVGRGAFLDEQQFCFDKGWREGAASVRAAIRNRGNTMTDKQMQEPLAWKWHQAPVKTLWGHDMVVADLAIDKDNTVSVCCERDQTAKVEAMFTPPAAQRQWVEMSDARIKGIFSYHGQSASGKDLPMLRVIEAMIKENT